MRAAGESRSPAGSLRNGARFAFRCRDPRDAQTVIGRLFERNFDLRIGHLGSFAFNLQHFGLDDGASLTRIDFGTDVTVRIDRVESFMVQMPLAGHNDLVLDGKPALNISEQTYSVINPGQHLNQRRDRKCQMVLIRFNEDMLRAALESEAGLPEGSLGNEQAIRFDSEMIATGPGGVAWRRLMSFILGELGTSDSLLQSPTAAKHAAHLLASTLLANHTHNYDRLLRTQVNLEPRIINDARDWMDANAHRVITVHDISRGLRVSSRSIYAAFKKHLGCTPMSYLKDLRLDKARNQLLLSSGSESVTDVAMHWGFFHLGYFARDYRARFGERPSETLRMRARS